MDASLVIEALNRSLGHRQVEQAQLLQHTDQASQHRSTDYRNLLKEQKIVCSLSSKGCCSDNTVVESFFFTLIFELTHHDNGWQLISPQQLQFDLAFWIEAYYNCERRHPTIGYVSSIDY